MTEGTGSYYQDKELFKGTAGYYVRYRPAYPPALFDLLVRKFQLNGRGCLLDLGSGPGDLAIPLARYFEQVVALDVEAEMLAEGRRQAAESGVSNIRWVQKRAEDLSEECGHFKLVTIGKAFHWMEQEKVLGLVRDRLEPGGGIAIIGELGRLWGGKQKWHAVVISVIKKYLGEERRAGKGLARFSDRRWEDLLPRYFPRTEYDHTIRQNAQWEFQTLLGFLYSTSSCSREILGEKVENFEKDLKAALWEINSQNIFAEEIQISVLMGWKNAF